MLFHCAMSLFSIAMGIPAPEKLGPRSVLGSNGEFRYAAEQRARQWQRSLLKLRNCVYFVSLAGLCIFVRDGALDWHVLPPAVLDADAGLRGHAVHLLASFLVLGTAEVWRQDVGPTQQSPSHRLYATVHGTDGCSQDFEIDVAGMEMLYRHATRCLPGDHGLRAATGMGVMGISGLMVSLSSLAWLISGRWTDPVTWWFADATSLRYVWIMATLLWALNDVCETVRLPVCFCRDASVCLRSTLTCAVRLLGCVLRLALEMAKARPEAHVLSVREAWIVTLGTRLYGLLWWTGVWTAAAPVDIEVEFVRRDVAV